MNFYHSTAETEFENENTLPPTVLFTWNFILIIFHIFIDVATLYRILSYTIVLLLNLFKHVQINDTFITNIRNDLL